MNPTIAGQIQDSIDLKRLLLAPAIEEKIEKIAEIVSTAYQKGNKVILCGNGGSAADAMHMEGELVGRFRMERKPLPAMAIVSAPVTTTAIGNDYGYDNIFSRQIEAHGKPGDVLFVISTSGNSPNTIAAIASANKAGMASVGLLGKTGGQIKDLVDVALVIPSEDIPRIQECHMLIGHIVCDYVEQKLFG